MAYAGESKIREAIDLALQHQRAGRLRAAGNIYRRVLRIDPENPDALHFLGVIAHKVGRSDLALELLNRSIAADPTRVGFHLNLGNLYLKRQLVAEAIACYRNAIELEPTSASAHAHLAGALARQGKLEEANQAFGLATQLKPLVQAASIPNGPIDSAPVPWVAQETGPSVETSVELAPDAECDTSVLPELAPDDAPPLEASTAPHILDEPAQGTQMPLEWALATEDPPTAADETEPAPQATLIPTDDLQTAAGPIGRLSPEVQCQAQPAVAALAETVAAEPLEFVIPVTPEPEPGEPAPAAADVAPPRAIELVLPVGPQAGAVTAGGEKADEAARAALALQYAWALHFDTTHPVPAAAVGVVDVDEPEPDADLFALPEGAPTSDGQTAYPGFEMSTAIAEGVDMPAVTEHSADDAPAAPPEPAGDVEADPVPGAPLLETDDSNESEMAIDLEAGGDWELDEPEESFELDNDSPLLESLGPLSMAGEPVEAADAEPVIDSPGGEVQQPPEARQPSDPTSSEPNQGIDPAPKAIDTAEPGAKHAERFESTAVDATGHDAEVDGSAEPSTGGQWVDDAIALPVTTGHAGQVAWSSVPIEAPRNHVRPGVLGEAHAQALSDRPDLPGNGGMTSSGIDRSAETLPLPGTPGLRLRKGPAALPAGRSRPPSAESLRRRGVSLVSFRRLDEAIHLFNQAVSLRPRFAEAHRDLGGAMLRRGDLEGAIASLQRALQLRPGFAEAWGSLGDAFQLEGKISQAIRCYRRLLELVPRAAKVHSNLLLSMNYDPSYSTEEVFQEHLRWAERHAEPLSRDIEPHNNDRTPHRRLKIGYVSPDFRRHSVNYFAEPVLAGHYRRYFHVTCYSDVIKPDGVTRGLADMSDDFRDSRAMNDEQLAAQVRADRIDILVDLSGHTGNNRLGTFARKPAPVQVTYLGYPNTTGLGAIDYRITDALADPPGLTERLHSEHLVRLPETFLCYQPPPTSPEVGPLPCLKAGYVTFGCFNILAKITDEVMALWARILQELPDSRLVLKGRSNSLSVENRRQHVRDVFVNHGIPPERLELLGKEPNYAQHLSHYGRLDIVLDPFPYNGTTTTCEALWMGLPVITLAGDRHVSRVGVSILNNVGLPALIADTPEQYVQIATSLADSPKDLSRLRSTLRERMLCSPLTDSIRLTRALEAEYRNMWVRWCQSSPVSPAPIDSLARQTG